METVLVTGGAGYIGAEVANQLLQFGYGVIIIDNLSTGDFARIPTDAVFVKGDISDEIKVNELLEAYRPDHVMHFAAFKQARESQINPEKYWDNNVKKFVSFLGYLSKFQIKSIVLSSSCSVYGNSGKISPDQGMNPVSTYGHTKAVSEKILEDFSRVNGWKFLSLRYFNVIGAGSHTNSADVTSECLVPVILNKIYHGEIFSIYGNDFSTPDGTAIRDYIDVRDIAAAHVATLRMRVVPNKGYLNISTGVPTSVKQVIDICEEVTGLKLRTTIQPRNLADPDQVWAEIDPYLKSEIWEPRFSINDSIKSHWESFLQIMK